MSVYFISKSFIEELRAGRESIEQELRTNPSTLSRQAVTLLKADYALVEKEAGRIAHIDKVVISVAVGLAIITMVGSVAALVATQVAGSSLSNAAWVGLTVGSIGGIVIPPLCLYLLGISRSCFKGPHDLTEDRYKFYQRSGVTFEKKVVPTGEQAQKDQAEVSFSRIPS